MPLTRSDRNFGLVLKRDNDKCQYCGDEATEVDHIIPYAYSGNNNSLSNLVASCGPCNRIASDYIFDSIDDKRFFILKERRLLNGFYLDNGKIIECGLNVLQRSESIKRNFRADIYCDTCKKWFSGRGSIWERHLTSKQHLQIDFFGCVFCKRMFRGGPSTINEHIERKHLNVL